MKLSKFTPRNLWRVALREARRTRSDLWIRWMNWHVGRSPISADGKPVIFFNASTRISLISLNAAYSLIASWMVRVSGVPVIHFVCQAGMRHCVLGTDHKNPHMALPCRVCIKRSRVQYAGTPAHFFEYDPSPDQILLLEKLSLNDLYQYEQPVPVDWLTQDKTVPLGQLVLPAVRWFLRRHNLIDDDSTRYLYREFILSAWNVGRQFYGLMQRTNPQLVVVFNGQFFPEATVRWVAHQRGIRVISHEVGLYPMTGFFTDKEATIYPIEIPEEYDLGPDQIARMNAYLEKRFKGKFSMAGIQFWPEMQGLEASLLERLEHFKQVVPVFTNVIFDTSQPHSNILFKDMFEWLDNVLEIARNHTETFFIIRAHPDESRPGKAATESVAMWVQENRAARLPNIMFVSPDEYISSYELILRSKFVMVYNSTIGLEASILGVPVLAAGKSRYTGYPTVFFPPSQAAYLKQCEQFLAADKFEAPPEHRRQARRFLYYHVFRVSLSFDEYLEPAGVPGFVYFKPFNRFKLSAEKSTTARAILDGLFDRKQFELDDDFMLKE
jgi:hypothetical protein